ncbi:RES family NAD+ phosphorylase [Phnomibacter sp. MR]|uniref:RES family NAD+ phosphorylase n=1 Tax=Phnomibacter sp. MR TaxID=3042318 RepID=UPI003A80A897
MEVFRLSRAPFATPLSGRGAALYGARWNSVGIEMIYTAGNRSLAMAEVAVHLSVANMPSDFQMITIDIPDGVSTMQLKESHLPVGWNQFPHHSATQKMGDQFVLDNKYCVCKVPSAVTKGDYNWLINPNHKDFSQIQIISIEDFPFDARLFKA